jgi:hypothetical protein
VLSGFFVHWLTRRRDEEKRRKELVLPHLIQALRDLEESARDESSVHKKKELLEKATADIQVFGSPYQIRLTHELIDKIVKTDTISPTDLVHSLRDDIRRNLGLHSADAKFVWFRLTISEKPKPTLVQKEGSN